jgi:hypothetical protein
MAKLQTRNPRKSPNWRPERSHRHGPFQGTHSRVQLIDITRILGRASSDGSARWSRLNGQGLETVPTSDISSGRIAFAAITAGLRKTNWNIPLLSPVEESSA